MQRERVLRFPPSHSLGRLVVVPPGYRAAPGDPGFVPAVPAQGDVLVPIGSEVRLHLRFDDAHSVDLSPLTALEPDAVDHLSLDSCSIPDAELRHLAHLTGLSRLYLRDTGTTDGGLVHIGRLIGLRVLDLDHVRVSDTGLACLQSLAGLRLLELTRTRVTSAGIQWVGQTLPDCEVRCWP